MVERARLAPDEVPTPEPTPPVNDPGKPITPPPPEVPPTEGDTPPPAPVKLPGQPHAPERV
ncbi:MAG TPA: hypothetical protein VLJ86_06335 [Ramlibacter sp.]|nr:hypothetical protein [Ramlibacter sp.]